MSRVIAISNQKGGVGKTTTTINLAACLAENGKKVLAIDMDPQGNMSSGLGVDKEELEASIYQVLLGECGIEDALVQGVFGNLDVLPASVDLSALEIELIDVQDKEYILKKEVDKIKNNYDIIIIDCPPALSILTINAMTTADSVIIPIQCEYYALEGLTQLGHMVELVTERLNADLKIEGIVFTMYDSRTNLSLQVVENVRENLELPIYDTVIPRNIKLAEAPSYGLPISIYDAKSAGAKSYMELAKEVIRKGGQ